MEITGKAAVVVGGASGMAKATAEMLVRKGAQVSILDLPRSKGPQVAKELRGSFHACDVTDFEGTELALTAACDKLRALHFVCNTAGGGIALRTLSKKGPHPLDEFRRVIDLNLVATFNVARLAAARDRSCGADVLGQRTRPPDWTAQYARAAPVRLWLALLSVSPKGRAVIRDSASDDPGFCFGEALAHSAQLLMRTGLEEETEFMERVLELSANPPIELFVQVLNRFGLSQTSARIFAHRTERKAGLAVSDGESTTNESAGRGRS